MVRRATKAAKRIAETEARLVVACRYYTTDPAVGGVELTAFFLEQDKPTQHRLMAVKAEAEAAVHRTIADANTKIAEVLKSRG